MKVNKIRLSQYRKLFSALEVKEESGTNFLFVHHSHLTVDQWKKMRRQGELLGFNLYVVKASVLNATFIRTEIDFCGSNAVIAFKGGSKANPIINYIKSQPKLILWAGRLSNGRTYKSFPFSSLQDVITKIAGLLQHVDIIKVVSHHYINLIRVLHYANNKSSSS